MCIKHDGKYLQPQSTDQYLLSGIQAGLTGFCVSSPSPTSFVVQGLSDWAAGSWTAFTLCWVCRWKKSLKITLNAKHISRAEGLWSITVCINYHFHIQTQRVSFPSWMAEHAACWLVFKVISRTCNCTVVLFIWWFKHTKGSSVDLMWLPQDEGFLLIQPATPFTFNIL